MIQIKLFYTLSIEQSICSDINNPFHGIGSITHFIFMLGLT